MVMGYGLAWKGLHGNLPYLGTLSPVKKPAAGRKRRPHKPARGGKKKKR
jgi:hypothetical protein